MKGARHRDRTAVLGGGLCLAALVIVLVGGIVHADAAVHRRSAIAVTAIAGGDGHGAALRLDQAGALAAAVPVLLGGLVLLRRWTSAPSPTRFTAHSPAPRGPPGQGF